MTLKQRKQFWRFAWKESRHRFLLGIVVTLVLAWFLSRQGTDWWSFAEPALTILTLVVAWFIGYQQMREEWEEDHLPKRLSASFYHNGKEVMCFKNAQLAGEADIRALTQQIGWQMNHLKEQLKFIAPDIQVSGPQVSQDGSYVHYTAKVILTELPSTLPADTRRTWTEPFFENGQPSFKDSPLT